MRGKRLLFCMLILMLNLICFEKVNFLSNEIKVSAWARNEITDAEVYELLVSDLGNDFTRNLTRKEFCELVVNMIEVASSTKLPVVENPFLDTNNISIIKAYGAGLVNGISREQFSPNSNISREEIAVIMCAAYRINERTLGKSIVETAKKEDRGFLDEKQMAPWAFKDIKLASKIGIMNGNEIGMFFPKENMTVEEGIIIVKRLYEKQILNKSSTSYGSENDTSFSIEKANRDIYKIDGIVFKSKYLPYRGENKNTNYDGFHLGSFYDEKDTLKMTEEAYMGSTGKKVIRYYYLENCIYVNVKEYTFTPIDPTPENVSTRKFFIIDGVTKELVDDYLVEYKDTFDYNKKSKEYHSSMKNSGKQVELLRTKLNKGIIKYEGLSFSEVKYLHGEDYTLMGYGGYALLIYEKLNLTLGFNFYESVEDYTSGKLINIYADAIVQERIYP